MQDMGAAGLISSTFEMSANCGYGFKLNLEKVPLRADDMSYEEILLSESQERMLMIVQPCYAEKIKAIMNFYDLCCEDIGEVGFNQELEIKWNNEVLFKENPQEILNADIQKDWSYFDIKSTFNSRCEIFKNIFKSNFDISTIYEQFDQSVGCRTAASGSSDVGFLLLEKTNRALGVCIGGQSEVFHKNFPLGVLDCFFNPVFKLAIKAAKAVGATNCLNFGAPSNNQVMSELVFAIEQLAVMCEKTKVPMISGNVSLNNVNNKFQVLSTPVVVVVGLRDCVNDIPKDVSQSEKNYRLSVKLNLSENFDQAINDCVYFYEFLYDFSTTLKPKSSQMIGLNKAFKKNKSSKKNSFSYEVLFEVEDKKSALEFFAKKVKEGIIYRSLDD